MTDLRAGATRLFLPTLETEGQPRGKFLDAVREAAVGEFEILGELGRRGDGGIAYLAQDLSQPRLVALRLEPGVGGKHDYVLTVLQELDGSLPSSGTGCLRCSETLRGWGRFCPRCGYDTSGLDPSGLAPLGPEIRNLVGRVTGPDCEILGEMSRAEGGGRVYFARPEDGQTIVGLRIREGEETGFAVDQTAEITYLPNSFIPDPPAASSGEGHLPGDPELAPTVLADFPGAFQDGEAGTEPVGPVQAVPQSSRWMIVLIVAAALTVGALLGIFLS